MSLPKTAYLEQTGRLLNDLEAVQERKWTTLSVISMLDVRFDSTEAKRIAVTEFATFLREYRLTGNEVVEAYKLALKRVLGVKIYPTLSLIQLGEVLAEYMEYKRNDVAYNNYKKNAAKAAVKAIAHDAQMDMSRDFVESVIEDLAKHGLCDKLGFLYVYFKEMGVLKSMSAPEKRALYNKEYELYKREGLEKTMSSFKGLQSMKNMVKSYKEGLLDNVVLDRVKCRLVSEYLCGLEVDAQRSVLNSVLGCAG